MERHLARRPQSILIEQTYPGLAEDTAHFAALLLAFRDRRYMRVDDKPIFLLYKLEKLPDPHVTLALWRGVATEVGLAGLHLIGMSATAAWNSKGNGFDARNVLPLVTARPWISRRQPQRWMRQRREMLRGLPTILAYDNLTRLQVQPHEMQAEHYPYLIHTWDNTPRSGHNGVVFVGSSSDAFRPYVRAALHAAWDRNPDHGLVFLKAWHEWAEGNHLEPDLKTARGYL